MEGTVLKVSFDTNLNFYIVRKTHIFRPIKEFVYLQQNFRDSGQNLYIHGKTSEILGKTFHFKKW